MKPRLSALLLIIVSFSLWAQKYDPFIPVRDLMRSNGQLEEIRSLLEETAKTSYEYDGSYELFQAEYYRLLGAAYRLDNNKNDAKSALETSLRYANKMNDQAESARTLFYMSSAGFLLAEAEGLGSLISQADQLNAYLDKALSLAPNDPELLLQKASGLAYPPKIFGGDPQKAMIILEKGLEADYLHDYIRFDLLSTLSYCYQREGENQKALALAEEALLLYPVNQTLLDRKQELLKKVK